MVKTQADLAKLTARQREVLTAVVRQLSKDKVARFSQIAEDTANIDAAALFRAYATVQEALSKLESSTAPSISPALASLAQEWQALNRNEKTTNHEPEEPQNHSG